MCKQRKIHIIHTCDVQAANNTHRMVDISHVSYKHTKTHIISFYTHTHTQTRTHAHTHTQTRTHAHTHTHTGDMDRAAT
jgi:hypothetical protein